MRRAIVTSTVTVSGIVLLLSLKPDDTGVHAAQGTNLPISSSGSDSQAADNSAAGSAASPGATASAAAGTGSSATRSVTGEAADTRFGPVQVKVTFDGTKITKIDVLQYPSESRKDQEINRTALPILNQEAIAAQSAQIDAVSGATYTTDGYVQSLQSALDQAAK